MTAWIAGVAKAGRGAGCASALALALLGSAMGAQPPVSVKTVGAVSSETRRSDAMALGVPSERALDVVWSDKEAAAWSQSISKYPGASLAVFAAYKIKGAGAPGAESGVALWSPAGCRILMPRQAQALAEVAKFARVGLKEAKKLRLDELEALHELGHCWARLDQVKFAMPGLSEDDEKALAERVFSPVMSFLDNGGYAARVWGESFADAFMAIERLALDGAGPAALEALRIVSKARKETSKNSARSDGHSNGAAIDLALKRAGSWKSMEESDRLSAAREIASESALLDWSAQGEYHESRVLDLSSAQIGRAALEDAGARWAAAQGRESQYEDFSLAMGFGPERAVVEKALEELLAQAKRAMGAASEKEGLSWSEPEEYVFDLALRAASRDALFEKALSDFNAKTHGGAWPQALDRAVALAARAQARAPSVSEGFVFSRKGWAAKREASSARGDDEGAAKPREGRKM